MNIMLTSVTNIMMKQLHEHHADQFDQHDDQPVKVECGVEDVETPVPVCPLLIS